MKNQTETETAEAPVVAFAVVDKETLEVVKRVDVAGKSERFIIEAYQGLSRRLNRQQYFVREVKATNKGAPS